MPTLDDTGARMVTHQRRLCFLLERLAGCQDKIVMISMEMERCNLLPSSKHQSECPGAPLAVWTKEMPLKITPGSGNVAVLPVLLPRFWLDFMHRPPGRCST